jgi:hypothetical protein
MDDRKALKANKGGGGRGRIPQAPPLASSATATSEPPPNNPIRVEFPDLTFEPSVNLEYDLFLDADMPPTTSRLVPKDRFGHLFGTLRTQAYTDPGARGPGSHR